MGLDCDNIVAQAIQLHSEYNGPPFKILTETYHVLNFKPKKKSLEFNAEKSKLQMKIMLKKLMLKWSSFSIKFNAKSFVGINLMPKIDF